MKLLTKLNIRYILYSLVVMVISAVAIYIILSVIINRQMDEQLSGNLQRVENHLASSPVSLFIEPFGSVHKIEKSPESIVFSDTLVFNQNEKESEIYRQVTAVKNIGGNYFRITVLKSKIETEDLLTTLALITILAMLLLTITLILVNRRVAKSVWRPFYHNLKIIEQFSANEKKPVILEETGITEFDKLKSVLTSLTKHIITDFQNQKQFSEDVSHELQTPLAIISSRLETLLNDSELSQHHAEVLQSIYSSVQRLSKLNKELILLSKIENNQFSGNETTSLKILVVEKLDEFNELIRLKNLKIETSLDDDFIIETNPVLAGILINNLLSNSINYTPEGGKIKIKTSAGNLSFCNSGNFEISEPEKLFDRFYKADPSSGSVGLGLAIVKKICDIQNLSVRYYYSESFHCFDLKL